MPSRHPVARRGACCGSFAATRLGALDQDGRRWRGRVRHTDGRCRAFRIAGGPLPAVDAARPPGQNCRQHGGGTRQAGSNEECRPAFEQEHCRRGIWFTLGFRGQGSSLSPKPLCFPQQQNNINNQTKEEAPTNARTRSSRHRGTHGRRRRAPSTPLRTACLRWQAVI